MSPRANTEEDGVEEEIIQLSGTIELFGLEVRRTIGDPAPEQEPGGAAPHPAIDRICCFGLIEPEAWRVSQPWDGPFLSWAAPEKPGAFRYDLRHASAERPRRIPLRIVCWLENGSEASGVRRGWSEERGGAGEPQLDPPRGWMWASDRPLLLDGDSAELDPDAFDCLHLSVTSPQALALVSAIERGETRGVWTGELRIGSGRFPLEVSEHRAIELRRSAGEDTARLRLEWEEAMAWREARLSWDPELPNLRRWGDSDLHVALRQAIPNLARRAIREAWSDERRSDVFRSFAHRVMEDWRLYENGAFQRDQPREEVEGDLTGNSTQTVLGCPGIDPYTYQLLGGPDVEFLNGLAEGWDDVGLRYESDLLCRRILHAYLTAETGAYLNESWCSSTDSPRRKKPFILATLRPTRSGFVSHPEVEKWQREQEKALSARSSRWLAEWFAYVAFGSAVGFLALGVPGGLLGLVAGGWVGNREWKKRVEEWARSFELADAMQKAVSVAGTEGAGWEDIEIRMRAASRLGAVWPPAAWRLVYAPSPIRSPRHQGHS